MDVVVKQEPVFSWLDLDKRACEWCSSPDYMREQIPDYVEKPLDEWQEPLLDLCYCYDCVQEYHRLLEELIERDHHFRRKFQSLDIERLTQTIAKALDGPLEGVPVELQVPLMEILRYPYFLHHKQLAGLFVEGMIAVFKCNYPLKLEEKLPGAYLLLVHPRREVRIWADGATRSLGLISPDDYDLLVQVIKWMVQIVQLGFDIGEPEHKDELPLDYLPTHLYFPLTERDYWRGLVVLVMRMEVSTVQSCFMSSDDNGHREFLEFILSTMKCQIEEEGTFWHILQCFVALLEKLEERIWQMPEFKSLPGDVFNIITENAIYSNYIQQRQEEGEASLSQEACRNSSRGRPSSSSCRSYRTALAWFKPFVQSLLVFDSGGEYVSEVVRYLHNVADPCSFQSSFRLEVQSSLLTVICDLLAQGLLQLLVPTVRLWAIDMVDVATSGSADISCKLALRKLQDVLKHCHRRRFKNALKYSDLFKRMPLPRIPERDKQEIISLVIQRFEEHSQGPQFPLDPVIQISSSKLQELMESAENMHIMKMLERSPYAQPNLPPKEEQAVNDTKQRSASVVGEGRISAHGVAGPMRSTRTEEENKQRKEEKGKCLAANDKQCSADMIVDATAPFVTRVQSKRKIDPTVRSWGKAGPSTRVSSSEDEDEEQYWAQIKRPKKRKHPYGNVRISKKSLAMLGSSLEATVQLPDCRQKDRDLLPIRKRDIATTRFSIKDKGTVQGHHLFVKREAKPKRRFTARKSAGSVGKRASSQKLQGATSNNPIVLSDDEDNADEISVKKEPFSLAAIDVEWTDESEDWDAALIKVIDKHDSTLQSNVLRPEPEIPKPVLSNSLKEYISEDPNNSDEDLFVSVFNDKAASSPSTETPARDVPFSKLKTQNSEKNTSAARESDTATFREERLNKLDTILYPELMDAEVDDSVNIRAEVDEEMNEISDDKEDIRDDESDDHDESNHQLMKLEGNPESTLREEDRTLSSISRQLDNYALDNGVMNFWDDHSEFIWNSQDNALASIEDDLEELNGAHHQDVKVDDSGFHNEPLGQLQGDHLNEALPSEGTDAVKSNIKRARFHDDINPADAPASSVVAVAPPAGKPADTTPQKVLTDDEFFHEIVCWKVAQLDNPKCKGKNAGLPRNFPVVPMPEKHGFDSIDQYYETLKPLLFMEIWAKAVQNWWNKDVVKKRVFMDVLDGSTSNITSMFRCSGKISQEQNNKTLFPMESDLVVVRLIVGDGRDREHMRPGLKYCSAVFGIVEKAEVKRVQSARRASTESSGEDDAAEAPKFNLTLNIKTTTTFRPPRKSCIQVEYVTSLLTALRQWVGLMNIPTSILACDILKPRKADYFCLNDYQHSSLVSKKYNESQEKVISTAANAVHLPYPIPRICLVQGPPGTGKSHTIVGLVKEILNRPQDPPAPTATGPAILANKYRILLCAPSNAAIDELIGQIARAQIRLDKRHENKENRRSNHQRADKEGTLNNCGELCLVRVGRKSHVHSSVTRFWLDNLTKDAQKKSSTSSVLGNLSALKEDIRACDAREKELEREIWRLKNSGQDNAFELNEREDEMASLKNRKKALQIKCRMENDKQRHLRREEARIRRRILDSADIVCTTLSGSGSKSLKDDLGLRDDLGRRRLPFTCVIVDEACQSTELDLLIPLGFKTSKLVLVGDPEQLPPTVVSEKAKTNLFDRSMFQRLQRFFRHHEMGRPVLMLEEQYRMHPQIAAFPSRHVYSSRLKSHSSLETRPFLLKTHYAIFDVHRGQEICQERGLLQNPAEVDLIVSLCSALAKELHQESVGIITPYRQQKGEIQKRLHGRELSKIEVDTVDGFQGREKDVIVLSCVRAKSNRGSIGFVSDKRRMNVALTRARHALYVFGDMETLKNGSRDWRALITDAQLRKCIFSVQYPQELLSILSIESTNDGRSPAKDPRLKSKVRLARGSDGPTCSEFGSLREVPHNLSHRDERGEDKVISATTKTKPSAAICETRQSVPVVVKDKALIKKGGGAFSKKKVTWADLCDQKSAGDGPGEHEVSECTTNSVNEVRRGKDDRHQVNDRRAKEAGTSQHRHHHFQGNLEDRLNTIRRTHNDHSPNHRHHGDRQSSKEEHNASLLDVQEHAETEAAEQSDATLLSNSEGHRSRQDKQDHVVMGTLSNREEMECRRTFYMAAKKSSFSENDRSSSTTRLFCSNSFSNREKMYDDNSHMDSNDSTKDPVLASVIENNRSHSAGYYLQLHQQEKRSAGRAPHTPTTAAPSASRMPSTETALDNTLPITSLSSSRQPLVRLSASQSTNSTIPQTPATAAPSGSRMPSTETALDSTLPTTSLSSSRQPLSRLSASQSTHSTIPQTPATAAPSGSRMLSTETALNGTLSTTSLSSSRQPLAKLSASHSTHSTAHLVPSTTSGSSWLSREGSRLPSSFITARRSSEEASLTSNQSSLGLASKTISGELPPDVQEKADAARQRHPLPRSPPIIEARAVTGLRNPHGGAKQRTAHIQSRDVSSLREKAVDGLQRTERRNSNAGPRIDKTKYSKNFRGRINWHTR